MSEVETNEIETLKSRLDLMGITYHHKAGVEKLRGLLSDALASDTSVSDAIVSDDEPKEVEQTKTKPKDDPRALVRVFVSCNNPAKSQWNGEIFSVGNKVVGTMMKYVAFNCDYHIPRIIYDYIKEKQFQQFFGAKDSKGNKVRSSRLVKEFNVELLEPLTEKELKELAQRQAMASGDAAAVG